MTGPRCTPSPGSRCARRTRASRVGERRSRPRASSRGRVRLRPRLGRVVHPRGPEERARSWTPRRRVLVDEDASGRDVARRHPHGRAGPGPAGAPARRRQAGVRRHGLEDPVGRRAPRSPPTAASSRSSRESGSGSGTAAPGSTRPACRCRAGPGPSRSPTGRTAPAWSSPPPTAGPGPRTPARTGGSSAPARPPVATCPHDEWEQFFPNRPYEPTCPQWPSAG